MQKVERRRKKSERREEMKNGTFMVRAAHKHLQTPLRPRHLGNEKNWHVVYSTGQDRIWNGMDQPGRFACMTNLAIDHQGCVHMGV